MKTWKTRVLWFVIGIVLASSFSLVSAHRARSTQLSLEDRVTNLEKSVKALAEVVSKKADEPKPDRSRN
jgi:hypothetical protein